VSSQINPWLNIGGHRGLPAISQTDQTLCQRNHPPHPATTSPQKSRQLKNGWKTNEIRNLNASALAIFIASVAVCF
jgi:hypothetical protein